jgi:hypothetical protein
MADSATATANGGVSVVSLDAALDNRSRAPDVIASPMAKRLVENPVRNSRVLKSRTGLTLAIGVVLTLSTIAAAQWQIASHSGTRNPLVANVF